MKNSIIKSTCLPFIALSCFTSLALAGETGMLAVVNKADASISLIDLETGVSKSKFNLGYFPHEITGSSDGTSVFVSNYGKDHVRSQSSENKPGNTIFKINLLTQRIQEIELGLGTCAPHGIEISKDGEFVYVTCEDREEVAVVDAANGKFMYAIPTMQSKSHMLALSPDQSRLYVANFGSASVTVLDLKSRTIIGHINTGAGTEGIGISPDGAKIYATAVLEDKISVIDSNTLRVIQQIDTDPSPIRVLATPDGKYLLVNSSRTGYLQIFDANLLTFVKRIKVGKQPIGLTVPNSQRAFVANMGDNTVSEIDLTNLEVRAVYATGAKPDGLVYLPSR
ncbi:MAG: beta-propeller fold lactonase family protein [Oligoflexales bacterium]|nr:beta-propeller fold lactonase family protein [Oligoflexales bacterium]